MMATTLLSGPNPSEVDGETAPPVLERVSATFKDKSERFLLPKERDYEKQYSNLYYSRLMTMRAQLFKTAKRKWGEGIKHASGIIDLVTGEPVVLVGTLYKDMKLKPSILDEFHAREHYEAPPPERSKYCDDEDSLVLEDQTGRVSLTGNIDPQKLVTGILLALKGHEQPGGDFFVEAFCFADLGEQPPSPAVKEDKYVCLVSGLNIAQKCNHMMSLQMFVDFVTGQLGGPEDQDLASKIVRLIIGGNLIGQVSNDLDNVAMYKVRNMTPQTVESVKELDEVLTQLASGIPTNIMPGANDPSNNIVPQQPLHPCMFPSATCLDGIRGAPNPFDFEVDGVSFLGTSGQGVDDVYRYSASEDRLEILENTLHWAHLFPTAPDTLGCFPYQHKHRDPFAIDQCPHVYFAGNQPKYATKVTEGSSGQKVRLICVPDFSKTREVVLVNLRTLEPKVLKFDAMEDMEEE